MKVEVVEGKSEGPWKFPEAWEVVTRMEVGVEADDATGLGLRAAGPTGQGVFKIKVKKFHLNIQGLRGFEI